MKTALIVEQSCSVWCLHRRESWVKNLIFFKICIIIFLTIILKYLKCFLVDLKIFFCYRIFDISQNYHQSQSSCHLKIDKHQKSYRTSPSRRDHQNNKVKN